MFLNLVLIESGLSVPLDPVLIAFTEKRCNGELQR